MLREVCSFPVYRLPLIIYPSGKFIVVRNLQNPADSFIYRGHGAVTTVAKFAPNGFWVASGDISGKLRVWSWDHPEHVTKLETSVFGGKLADLDWDAESKKIAVGGEGSGVIVKCVTWDTGNNAGEMVGHAKRVLSVSYKPSRPYRVFTSSEDMRTCYYEGPPFKLHHSNSTHSNFVNCVRFSPDGNRAVSVGSDKLIQAYDGKTGEPTADVKNAHAGGIYSVAFSPDSTQFITASADKTVKLWNAETLALEQTFNVAADPQVGDMQVAVLWTKHAMLSVSLNGNINILNRASPEAPERVIQAHQVSVTAVAIDRDTQALYTGSYDGVVCKRALAGNAADALRLRGQDKGQLSGAAHSGKVVGVTVTQNGLVSVGWDDKLRISTVDDANAAYHTAVDLNGQPCGLATCRATTDLVLVVTNAEAALYRGSEKVSSIAVSALGFNPTCCALLNEEEVAIGGEDNKTHIFALQNLNFVPLRTLETRSAVSSLAYHPSGSTLAVGDNGRQVELFERGSWEVKVQVRHIGDDLTFLREG
jgi:WD40 repeat protein